MVSRELRSPDEPARSCRFLAERTSLPIVGVGGIMSRDDGEAMLDAGASLLQIYTGFVYAGPSSGRRSKPPETGSARLEGSLSDQVLR